MKLVKMRTKELENERDMLVEQNEEKTQLITRSKLLERELQKSLEDLKKIEKSKDEFVAMVTHELKTPLVPIKGFVDLLLSEHLGTLNDKQKERLEIIQSSSDSLLILIQDLLDAQKIELGQLKLDKKENDLYDLIKSAVEKAKSAFDHKGITVTLELERNIICLCDKGRIEQVLNNLFLNSIDFVSKNDGKIDIKLHTQNENAEIIVKDNGIGIDESHLGKLFVKFYQVNTSMTRERGGTGLGLSICKGIIENHEGKIWIESQGLGTGSQAHILLPLVR